MTTIQLHPPPAKFSPAHALLGRLYLENRGFLRNLLLRQAIPSRDVDDLVQDVFVTAWRRLENLVTPGQARPWLLVIGLNHASNYRRRVRYEREVLAGFADEVFDREDEASSFGSFVHSIYGMFRLRRFLSRISRRIRDVLVPYLLEGRALAEVAASLGITTTAAYGRLQLAREHLKRFAPT